MLYLKSWENIIYKFLFRIQSCTFLVAIDEFSMEIEVLSLELDFIEMKVSGTCVFVFFC